ncbi:hypothetical protein K2173_028363 [Erythroxylum novogranatense]|uniref:BAHD acyltransferase n=1 Tax=Erythroxylum novogranatense TaxID=1862640 RepID=A0AAV8U1M8_9ROSI|nr:hypothetical protein K2173_028363 [Erythroxylum novogranatense]
MSFNTTTSHHFLNLLNFVLTINNGFRTGGEEGDHAKVKITSKTHVNPSKKLGTRQCQLVTFDLPYLAFYYNQKLLLYKGNNYEEMVEKLKDGLGIVLEDFHQLAAGKDDDGVFRVEYDDEMDVEDLTVDKEGVENLKELIPYNGVLNLEGLHRPLLAIQLTKLKDGLAMGCAFNHAVLDGMSTWHFMSSGLRSAVDHLQSRSRHSSREPKRATRDAKLSPPLRESLYILRLTHRSNQVKGQRNLPSDGSKPFSTFQALSAHVWRHVTQARELKPEDITVFTVFADCRKESTRRCRIVTCNLIQAIFTATAGGLLLKHPPEFGASVIQKAIDMHNAKAIEERNKEWEAAPKIFQYKDAGELRGGGKLAEVSCTRWTSVGESQRCKEGSNNRFDGMMICIRGRVGD